MPISLNQPNGPGYGLNSSLAKAPLALLSGMTYSFRHFSLAKTDKESRYTHIMLGLCEMLPVIGGGIALIDWHYNKNITPKLQDNLSPTASTVNSMFTPRQILKNTYTQNPLLNTLNFYINESTSLGPDNLAKAIITICQDLKTTVSQENLQEVLNLYAKELDAFKESDQKEVFQLLNTLPSQEDIIPGPPETKKYLEKMFLKQKFTGWHESKFRAALEELETESVDKGSIPISRKHREFLIRKYKNKHPHFITEPQNELIQKPISTQKFIDLYYPDSPKYKDRMQAIATYFNKTNIFPIKGTGDCFFHSLIPGLLVKAAHNPSFQNLLAQKIEEFSQNPIPYVGQDSTPPFSKEEDFSFIKKTLPTLKSDIHLNKELNERLSRVLRYMCVVENESRKEDKLDNEQIPKAVGGAAAYTDVKAIGLINAIFNIKAYCAVLEKSLLIDNRYQDQTSPNSYEVFLTQGEETFESTDCQNSKDDAKEADFVLILGQGHFSCLT